MRSLLMLILLTIVFSASAGTGKDSVASIVSAEGTWMKSKVYLKCLLKDQREDGFLVFEVLKDGVYHYVGNVEVTGVPVDFPLLYCFNYEDPSFASATFRVSCITPGKNKIIGPDFRVQGERANMDTAEIEMLKERKADLGGR